MSQMASQKIQFSDNAQFSQNGGAVPGSYKLNWLRLPATFITRSTDLIKPGTVAESGKTIFSLAMLKSGRSFRR